MSELAPLFEYLESLEPGPIVDTSRLSVLLAPRWESFAGGGAEGMTGFKLIGRMEDAVWEPPSLSFVIERHGATVNGSSRAELHHWSLDIVHRTADVTGSGRRQLQPMQARLDVRPLAEEIAQLLEVRLDDERLKWDKNGKVRVMIGKILPAGSAPKETLAGRRKRFWATLDQLVTQARWRKVGSGNYAPPVDSAPAY